MPFSFKLPPGCKIDLHIPPDTPVMDNGTPILFGPLAPGHAPFKERDDCPPRAQTKLYSSSLDRAYDTNASKSLWHTIARWQQRGEFHLQLFKPIQEECKRQLKKAKATNEPTDIKIWESRLSQTDRMLVLIRVRLSVLVASARQFFHLTRMLSLALIGAQAGQQEAHHCVHDTCERLIEEQRIVGHVQDAMMSVMPGLLQDHDRMLATRITKKIMKDYPNMLIRIQEHDKAAGSEWPMRFVKEFCEAGKIWDSGGYPEAWPFVHN